MNGWKVLIVDDDPNVREIIRLYFQQHQIELFEAGGGAEALRLLEKQPVDVVVLDVMMPGIDGYETCREINKLYDCVVIMLTAKGDEFDRVLGLELGADDYMTKPFSPRELVSRMKAIFRRMLPKKPPGEEEPRTSLEYDGVAIYLDRREVVVRGEKISFRPKEFDLLAFLARSPGLVFSRDQLLEQVWGYDFVGDIRTVDVHIKKVRQKLSDFGRDCIHTVWGIGYKFEVDA
ncbi:response regulator transcription factor [Paenibacillus chartarius]|uniref:Response regulator transcription factor n=1 Tax=Paenibacillus chartarius TaxID=747481 RepID=A0ABV6DNB9_9BACL